MCRPMLPIECLNDLNTWNYSSQMTRRDYCAKCKKMVHDSDVMCEVCHVSLCSKCVTTYDALSRINKWCAKIWNCHTTTPSELRQFCCDVREAYFAWLKSQCEDQEEFDSEKKTIEHWLNDAQRYTNSDLDTYIHTCPISEMPPFICNMCHQGVKVVY